jgi:cell division protein FtsQ
MSAELRASRRGSQAQAVESGSGAPRESHRTQLIIAFAAAGVAALLVWLVAFSPVLGANRITVRGNLTITRQQVRDAARVPSGRPLLRLDTEAIRARVAALPVIAAAQVTVSYPSTVVISVTERVAVGYLLADGHSVLVDRTGRQFRTVAQAPTALPRFDLPSDAASVPAGEAVATVAGSLPTSVLAQLAVIRAMAPDAVILVLRDGRLVRWGSVDRSPDKAQLLPTLLARPGSLIDVTNPDEVYAH